MKGHVVVAEGEPEAARKVVDLLRADGYEVTEARGGEDAVRLVLALRPPVLVISEDQPDLPSREVFRRLDEAMGEDRPDSVLLYDSRGRLDGVFPELDGAQMLLPKPAHPTELLSFVRRLFAARERPGVA